MRRAEGVVAVLVFGPEAGAHGTGHLSVLAVATEEDDGMDGGKGREDANPEDKVEEDCVLGSAVEVDGQERHKDGQDDEAKGDALAWLGQSDCGGGCGGCGGGGCGGGRVHGGGGGGGRCSSDATRSLVRRGVRRACGDRGRQVCRYRIGVQWVVGRV